MINRTTGEVGFKSGLHIVPHCRVEALATIAGGLFKPRTQNLSLPGWKRHVFGLHDSEHGTFEVEALSAGEDRVQIVLVAHQHPFYEAHTLEDADRRTFHEGVVSSDLGGQREFAWGEVLHRLESRPNKNWLVIAYSREPKVPLPDAGIILTLLAHEGLPDDDL